jgi:hypothetical protein
VAVGSATLAYSVGASYQFHGANTAVGYRALAILVRPGAAARVVTVTRLWATGRWSITLTAVSTARSVCWR